MIELQNFLRNGIGSPSDIYADLTSKYAIKHSRHKTYNNLVLFKYNQIESPFSEQIVCESRGIIVDENDNFKIISRPFDKFFNHGEGNAAEINWSKAVVQEKLDGSLATIYAYDNDWHVATSGTPDASGNVNGYDFSFAELFWKTFHDMKISLPPIDCNKCFMFELTSPYNKVVVKYTTPQVTLIGARDLVTQEEISLKEASSYLKNCPVVKEFPLTSFEEIIDSFASIDPTCQEGYIVLGGGRVKVKSPAYVALHHMSDGLSSRKNLLTVVMSGEISEVIVHFPEYSGTLYEFYYKLDVLIKQLEASYESIKHLDSQKEFALHALKTRCSSALFALRSGKTKSISSFVRDMNVDSLMDILTR